MGGIYRLSMGAELVDVLRIPQPRPRSFDPQPVTAFGCVRPGRVIYCLEMPQGVEAMSMARVRMAEEAFMRPADDGRKYELVDGEAREMPAGSGHSKS